MELGATVCLPRAPRCRECPVAAHCRAARDGGGEAPDAVPARLVTTPAGVVLVAYLAGGMLWLEPSGGTPIPCREAGMPARADFSGLHQGLLSLPMTAWFPLPGSRAAQEAALAGFVQGLDPTGGPALPAARFRHAITRFRLLAAVVVRRADGAPGGPPIPGRPDGAWVPLAGAADLHVTQLTRIALRLIDPAGG